MARRRAAEYDRRRQLIRERAAELFARRGFAGASAADIAAACTCSKALIYHYFPSKEAILYDLLRAYMTALVAAAEAAVAGSAGPRRQFRALTRAHMRIYATARPKHILLLNELDRLPARHRARIIALERRLVRLAADLFERLAPALKRRPELRMPVAMGFYGLINWTTTWYRPTGRLGPNAFADLAAALFLDGLTAAVRAPR
ncbi:MAG: TetR family transcriptional regulator [Pseudomonadota bacterium]